MNINQLFSPTLAQVRSFSRPARLFLLATIFDGIVYSAWSLFFNFYILERGFSREFLGLANAAPSVGTLLLGIPLGLLSDRIGRKRAMLLGLLFSTLFMAAEVTVTSPALILAAAFLNGLAGMLYFLSQAPFMIKVSTPENRTLLFSLNFGLVTLAGAFGSVFAGQLPAFFGNVLHVQATSATAYQAVLLVSVLLSTVTMIPLLLLKEPKASPPVEAQPQPRVPVRRVILRPVTLKLALPNLLVGSGAAILIPYMNVYFRDRYAITDSSLGLLFSLSALLTGIGSLIGPRLAGSLGSKIRAVVLTQGFSLVFLLVVGFSPFLGLAAMAMLLRGVLMNMAVPLFSAFAMEQVPEQDQATVNGVKEIAWQIGWVFGPYVSGVVQEFYGFTPLFVATGVLYGAAILLTWVFFGRGQASLPVGEALLETLNAAEPSGD
jgi:MFS family permease